MKAYKITYMRIGYNEPWAGWKIAGKSSNIPTECSEDYFRLQSANSNSSVVKDMYDIRKEVWEYCIIGKNIYYSKLMYGINDQSPESRISMRADGVVYAIPENSELLEKPQITLNTPDSFFVNVPTIEKIYPALLGKNAPTVGLTNEDIFTTYASINISQDNKPLDELVEHYFPDKKILTIAVKCVIWAITEKSNPSINIIFEGSDVDKKNIIYILASLLPISMRSFISFRTYNIPGVKPLKFLFSSEKTVGRYLNIITGENNIIKENKLDLRYSKYDYIAYPIDHLDIIDSYFNLIHSTMGELGDPNSIDLNFLKIAHDIVLDEHFDDYHEMSDQEILKKFLDFISIPINNEKIDWYCAKLLETIIDNNIPLNDALKQRLKAKLKTTKSDALKAVGYSFDVINMINSDNKETEYAFLLSLKSNPQMFEVYRKKFLENKGGASFIDSFYGTYFGEKVSLDYESLLSFINETKDLQVRYYTDVLIEKRLKLYGETIISLNYSDSNSLRKEYIRYRQLLEQVYSTNSNAINVLVANVCKKFWSLFTFKDYNYQNKDLYAVFYLSGSKECQIVQKIIKFYDKIPELNPELPTDFKSFLYIPSNSFTPKDKNWLISDFRSKCVTGAIDTQCVEFWYNVADLDKEDFVSFIIKNRIKVFVDERLLGAELEKSEYFSKSFRVDILLSRFENYNCPPDEKQSLNEIIKCIRDFQRAQKKEEKEQAKEREKEKRERILEERDRDKRERKEKQVKEKKHDSEQKTTEDNFDVELDFVGGSSIPCSSNNSNDSSDSENSGPRNESPYKEEKSGGIKGLFSRFKGKK